VTAATRAPMSIGWILGYPSRLSLVMCFPFKVCHYKRSANRPVPQNILTTASVAIAGSAKPGSL
jgi:hypothetical protein